MLHNPADFGTSEEAKAMLKKAVAAVKENKGKALDMFNKGEGLRCPPMTQSRHPRYEARQATI